MSIFLSYSRIDENFADLLYRLLDSKGYEVWLDQRDIDAGSRWDESVQKAIDTKSHLIVILSPESVGSENVTDEWSYALDEGKTVIPLNHRNCNVPMRLRRLQRIDFEKDFASAFTELIETLGLPDRRPDDRIELAKRDGLIFIELPRADIRIVFVYGDYPFATSFIKTVWSCLLWSVIPRGSTQDEYYEYGVKWCLRNKVTQEICVLRREQKSLLLHELGIEPNTEIEVVLLDE